MRGDKALESPDGHPLELRAPRQGAPGAAAAWCAPNAVADRIQASSWLRPMYPRSPSGAASRQEASATLRRTLLVTAPARLPRSWTPRAYMPSDSP